MFGLPEARLLFRKVQINLAGIHLHGILIIVPKKRRRLLAIIISIESISIKFYLTLILFFFL